MTTTNCFFVQYNKFVIHIHPHYVILQVLSQVKLQKMLIFITDIYYIYIIYIQVYM